MISEGSRRRLRGASDLRWILGAEAPG